MNENIACRADGVLLPAAPEFLALPDLGGAAVRGETVAKLPSMKPDPLACIALAVSGALPDAQAAEILGAAFAPKLGVASATGSRSMKRKPDEIRAQFFKQLSAAERLKVLRVFLDISDAAAAEVNSHSIEAKLLSVILRPEVMQ